MKGWYVRVDDDLNNTGKFLILCNLSPDMSSGSGFDDWVENKESLKDFGVADLMYETIDRGNS